MPYSRKVCRHCGARASDGIHISSRGKCGECAMANVLSVGMAMVSLSERLAEADFIENSPTSDAMHWTPAE